MQKIVRLTTSILIIDYNDCICIKFVISTAAFGKLITHPAHI